MRATTEGTCGCPKCNAAGRGLAPVALPAGVKCRWDAHPAWCVELWNRYHLYYRRLGLPLAGGQPDLLDAAEVELWAEAEKARLKRDRDDQQAYLRSLGLM